jgi:hypothetical protein
MANEPTDSSSSPVYRTFVLAATLVTTLLILWLLPRLQVAGLSGSERILAENTVRDTWAKILAGAFFLIAAYFTWRYVEAVGKTVIAAERTVAAAERNAMIGQETQITERFVRSMELLGDEKLEVRLGGIYALERIARESARDQGPITEVLATYVREHAGWREGAVAEVRPRADIQAILTVLGRRSWYSREEHSLDLHEVALANAYLPSAHFEKAFLYESNLEGAVLNNAQFQGAWLWKAHLRNAELEGARFEGADLTGAVGLTWPQLNRARIDDKTKLPEYLRATQNERDEEPAVPEDILPTKR